MTSQKADLVLRGGPIFQSLQHGACDGLAVGAGRVLAGGTAADIDSFIGPQTRIIELRGRAAMPGFNDAHQHLLSLGCSMMQVDLKPGVVSTLQELLAAVGAHARQTPPGHWIFGGRYDHYHLDVKRHPLREELDRVAPDRPVYIKRICGHMGVANSAALQIAGVSEATLDPRGGHIEKRDGRLTGLFQERAQEIILSQIPPSPKDFLIKSLELAGEHMLARGVTSIMDAAVGGVQGFDDYLAYQDAYRQGRLPVRSYLAIYGGPSGIVDACLEQGLTTGAGDEYVKVGPIKLFTDGSAGGMTAAMSEPYRGLGGDKGIFFYPDGELNEMVEHYHHSGYQVAVHAIGDAAIEQILNAYTRVHERAPSPDRRHRIEHCGYVNAAQIQRMRELGVFPAPQPIFVYDFGDLYVEVLGEQRPADSYPMRTWMKAGLHPAASSDAPVCDTNVMTNLYSMLTRRTAKGQVLGAHECLNMPEAIHACTYNGAYLSFSETQKGTLTAGQLADITVTDRNLLDVEPEQLLETQIDLTILGGRIVYDRLSEYHER